MSRRAAEAPFPAESDSSAEVKRVAKTSSRSNIQKGPVRPARRTLNSDKDRYLVLSQACMVNFDWSEETCFQFHVACSPTQ